MIKMKLDPTSVQGNVLHKSLKQSKHDTGLHFYKTTFLGCFLSFALVGLVPNASLVGKVLSDNPSRSHGGKPRGEGLINLLHAPPLPKDVPDLKIQRSEAPAQPSENR